MEKVAALSIIIRISVFELGWKLGDIQYRCSHVSQIMLFGITCACGMM
jgi:hypothetical protein